MLDCQQPSAGAGAVNDDAHAGHADIKKDSKKSPGLIEKFVKFMDEVELARVQKQVKTGPDSWLVRKTAVGMVIGIFGYAYYVFVVRLCVKMVRMEQNRLGDRTQGIVYLVIFHILVLMFVWSYGMVIFIAPGFARDFVPKTEPPPEKAELVQIDPQARYSARYEDHPQSPKPTFQEEDSEDASSRLNMNDTSGTFGVSGQPAKDGVSVNNSGAGISSGTDVMDVKVNGLTDGSNSVHRDTPDSTLDESLVPALATGKMPVNVGLPSASHPILTQGPSMETPPIESSTPPLASPVSPSHFEDEPSSFSQPSKKPPHPKQQEQNGISSDVNRSTATLQSFLHFSPPPDNYKPTAPQPIALKPEPKKTTFNFERVPPNIPVLTDDYRYDTREGFLRPHRSHRCRHCGTVILKMDHHCPWVGQCVGARNYKYFYNFLQWATIFVLFVVIAVTVANFGTFPQPNRPKTDPQQMVIIGLAGFFTIFTGTLLASHTRLVVLNLTTIEEIGLSRIKSRERSVLQNAYGFFGIKETRAKRKEWNDEWGRLGREANLWWLGSRRANWTMVFGEHRLGWFCEFPILLIIIILWISWSFHFLPSRPLLMAISPGSAFTSKTTPR